MKPKSAAFGRGCLYILHNKTLRQLIIGSTLVVTVGYGAIAWLPTYFVRVHAMTTIEVGQILALLIGIGGGIGTALGGHFADRLGKRDVRWNLWLIILWHWPGCRFRWVPILPPTPHGPLFCWLFRSASARFISGNTCHVAHLVKPEMRSLASAILLFINNIIGLGLGPLMIGAF